MIREHEEIGGWLFEMARSDWWAGSGWARADKKALVWSPGRRPLGQRDLDAAIRGAAYGGFTQVAWESWDKPVQEQSVAQVCWFGIDVDLDQFDERTVGRIEGCMPQASIRTSCGGSGLHALVRITPFDIRSNLVGAALKALCRPWVYALGAVGVQVCSSGYRQFWLVGGENRWIVRRDQVISVEPPPVGCVTIPVSAPDLGEYEPGVAGWVQRFADAGIRLSPGSNPIYVGTVVDLLRRAGETVHTRSGMRGNGQINGYVDLARDSISLWAYADGHRIWTWDEV